MGDLPLTIGEKMSIVYGAKINLMSLFDTDEVEHSGRKFELLELKERYKGVLPDWNVSMLAEYPNPDKIISWICSYLSFYPTRFEDLTPKGYEPDLFGILGKNVLRTQISYGSSSYIELALKEDEGVKEKLEAIGCEHINFFAKIK